MLALAVVVAAAAPALASMFTLEAAESGPYCRERDGFPASSGLVCQTTSGDFVYMALAEDTDADCDPTGCEGELEVDLSAAETITVSWGVGEAGKAIRVEGGEVLELEFQATGDCDGGFQATTYTPTSADIVFEGLEGPRPSLDDGFLDLGWADKFGPDLWEVFTRIKLVPDGPYSFTKATVTLAVDPSRSCSRPVDMEWGWEGYAWVQNKKGSLAVLGGDAPGVDLAVTVETSAAGQAVVSVAASGLSSGGRAAILYGAAGSFVVPGSAPVCPGLAVGIERPSFLAVDVDAAGNAIETVGPVDASIVGVVSVQVVDLVGCAASDVVLVA